MNVTTTITTPPDADQPTAVEVKETTAPKSYFPLKVIAIVAVFVALALVGANFVLSPIGNPLESAKSGDVDVGQVSSGSSVSSSHKDHSSSHHHASHDEPQSHKSDPHMVVVVPEDNKVLIVARARTFVVDLLSSTRNKVILAVILTLLILSIAGTIVRISVGEVYDPEDPVVIPDPPVVPPPPAVDNSATGYARRIVDRISNFFATPEGKGAIIGTLAGVGLVVVALNIFLCYRTTSLLPWSDDDAKCTGIRRLLIRYPAFVLAAALILFVGALLIALGGVGFGQPFFGFAVFGAALLYLAEAGWFAVFLAASVFVLAIFLASCLVKLNAESRKDETDYDNRKRLFKYFEKDVLKHKVGIASRPLRIVLSILFFAGMIATIVLAYFFDLWWIGLCAVLAFPFVVCLVAKISTLACTKCIPVITTMVPTCCNGSSGME